MSWEIRPLQTCEPVNQLLLFLRIEDEISHDLYKYVTCPPYMGHFFDCNFEDNDLPLRYYSDDGFK
jgi:hypothetical protein